MAPVFESPPGVDGGDVSGQDEVAIERLAVPEVLPAASNAATATVCVVPHCRPVAV